ncbi:substrate-binding domain-containing protein [bacterium]|nr:substrate-binding domain-containing protein [bacterium]MBU1984727.1 substrate-binding domain-containing protein [bacterium]
MRLLNVALLGVTCMIMVLGCGPSKPKETMTAGHVRIGASDAVFDLAWFLSREFQAGNRAAFIDIVRRANRDLVDSLLNGDAEEIFLDRTLTPAETLALRRTGHRLYSYPVAYYPVFLLVDTALKVESVDSAELRGILTGRVVNWRELGGPDLPINVYLPLPGEGAIQSIVDYFGGLDSLQAAAVCSTSSILLDSAEGDAGALILYTQPITHLPYQPLRFRRGDEAIRPNVKTILEENGYPFRLNITYVTTHMKTDVAAGYLTFVVGNLGQRRIMDAFKYRPASVPVRVIQMKH